MNNKKKLLVALGSVALIAALFAGNYIIQQNKYHDILTASEFENSENIIEKDTPTTSEYGAMVGNGVADNETIDGIVDEQEGTDETDDIINESMLEDILGDIEENPEDTEGDGSGFFGEPAEKLPAEYEQAMENSDLLPFEKEQIRLFVQYEGKTFAEAVAEVRPGLKVIEQTVEQEQVVEEETEVEATTPIEQPAPIEQQTPSTNNNSSNSGSDGYDSGYTEEQKKRDAESLSKFRGNFKGGEADKEQIYSEPNAFGN